MAALEQTFPSTMGCLVRYRGAATHPPARMHGFGYSPLLHTNSAIVSHWASRNVWKSPLPSKRLLSASSVYFAAVSTAPCSLAAWRHRHEYWVPFSSSPQQIGYPTASGQYRLPKRPHHGQFALMLPIAATITLYLLTPGAHANPHLLDQNISMNLITTFHNGRWY